MTRSLTTEHMNLVRENPNAGWPADVLDEAQADYTARLRGPIRTPEALPMDTLEAVIVGAGLTRAERALHVAIGAAAGAAAALTLVWVL